ncbi:MAG: Rne/Rng family ribonuclease, partial [Desulfovibrionaceae bacterium]|nr:Rne/Rng family ribonuclease [Desulfovibrionaceae bacterium]
PHDPGKGKKYPLIQKVLKPGQEVLVQVVKEPTGGKGAFLSTYLSIPGRFLVLTPGRTQFGVSRKVEEDSDRERLRALLDTLPTQDGLGVIMRTASLSASKTSMLKDLQVLKRQWKEVRTRGTTEAAPCLVYEEPSLAGRAVRDYLSDDIKEIWVDDPETAQEIKDTVSLIFPRRGSANLVRLHEDNQRTMWEAFDLKRQIEQIYQREVNLPSGGRLVFDQTEALMAIDINSGKIAGRNNFESMALRTNIEAAQVIARQLRLRDIGGQIVIDFIEMRERSHWRELEKVMRNAMKNDRARYDVAKVSAFGLMEVVRQRLGSSSISVTMEPCPCCNGTGMRRNMEWQALSALRDIRHLALHKSENEKQISYESDPEVALYLLNNKRSALTALEERYDVDVEIKYR